MFNLYHFIFQRLIWKITPTPISRISTLIPGILTIPTLISRIPIIPLILLPNSPFQLFQIAFSTYIFRNLSLSLI